MKPDKESEFLRVASDLSRTIHREVKGCISYTFFRHMDDHLKVTPLEHWEDSDALSAHIARPREMLGPVDDDESLPPTT